MYEDYGLFQRLTLICKEYPGANILLHKNGFLPQASYQLTMHRCLHGLLFWCYIIAHWMSAAVGVTTTNEFAALVGHEVTASESESDVTCFLMLVLLMPRTIYILLILFYD